MSVYKSFSRILNYKNFTSVTLLRNFHSDFSSKNPSKTDETLKTKIPKSGLVQSKYEIYQDEKAPVIFDVEEEKYRIQQQEVNIQNDQFVGINLNRGHHGVFDIEDLVEVLRKESALDIFVCTVPKHIKYVDYMCIVSGRSTRHMIAIAEFVRRVYKMKRGNGDILPRIEGETSRTWMALDLGNIALHIFDEETRKIYDLETLWSCGSEYDKELHKTNDPLVELFERHSLHLKNMKTK